MCPSPPRIGDPGADRTCRPRQQTPKGHHRYGHPRPPGGLWSDEDFAQWYPRDGQPGLSPAQLATVSVLQFLLELSDRQAAETVRGRIDFKYALALELDDPGIHHSVLTDFRARLTEDGRADKTLNLALGPGGAASTHTSPRPATTTP